MNHTINHTRFLIIKDNQSVQKLIWKKTNPQSKPQATTDQFNYRAKKQIIKKLCPNTIPIERQQSAYFQQFKIQSRQRRVSSSLTLKNHKSTSEIPNYIYTNSKRAQTADIKSSFSLSKFTNKPTHNLKQKVSQALLNKSKIIAVIKIRRVGLRYRIKYCFVQINKSITQDKFIQQLKQQFQEYKVLNKKPYLFHLGGQPINDLPNQINQHQYVILTDFSPRLNLQFQAKMYIFDQASKLQHSILACQKQFGPITSQFHQQSQNQQQKNKQTEQENQNSYEWKKIPSVSKYVDKIIQNPQKMKKNKKQQTSTKKQGVKGWLNQKYQSPKSIKQNDKNPLFQTISHYPYEIKNPQILRKVNQKLQRFQSIHNYHKYKRNPMDILLEKIRKQQIENQQNKKKIIKKVTPKQFQRKLDKKNTILSSQNIPFIMQKYGIVRSQAHNLYAIYKTLEKLSALRSGQQKYQDVYYRGIDRDTFDQGMKGLQINPGDEVIRNICEFPDYISWEQFLKIVSISLRKTPQQKLQAILQGIGGANNGYLTQLHIDIMVGSSLNKIFNRDEPDLKKYFVSVAIKQLDPNGTGKISIETLKKRVLGRPPQNMDIVSFLMLNS